MLRQSFFILLTVSYVISGRIPNMTSNEVCHDDQCRQVAKVILDGLDESVDPCKDFYSYACGKRKNENNSPPRTVDPNSDPQILSAVREILEATSKPEDSPALKIEKELYRKCMDVGSGDKSVANIMYLLNILNSTDGLKIFSPRSNRKFNKTWQDVDIIYSKYGFGHALFDIQVISDPEKSGQNVIALQPPPQNVTRKDKNSSILSDIQSITSPNFTLNIKDVIKRILKIDEDFEKDSSFEKVLQFATSLEQLVSECWAITVKPVRAKIHIRDWQKAYDGVDRKKDIAHINWLETLRTLFNQVKIELNESELIHIEKKEYFNRLSKMLEETDVDTITTYIHLRFLIHVAQYADINLAHLGNQRRWEHCVLATNRVGVSHEYANKYFMEDRRMAAIPILKDIHNYIVTQMFETWDDKEAKNSEIGKLEHMQMIVGYQDWVTNETYISNYYGQFEVKPTYLENMMMYKTVVMNHNLAGLRNLNEYQPKEIICDNFSNCRDSSPNFFSNLLPLRVIAGNEHQIIFPAEYFNNRSYSFLGSKLPSAINYGAYGSEMAHLVYYLSAFEDKINKKYATDKRTCFSKQVDETVKGTETDKVDAISLYLKSKGLRAAFDKYDKKTDATRMTKLHGLEKFNDNQLFFLSFAADTCSSNQNIDHLPISVNIGVSNMEEFSTAFQCPESSVMNRKVKCI